MSTIPTPLALAYPVGGFSSLCRRGGFARGLRPSGIFIDVAAAAAHGRALCGGASSLSRKQRGANLARLQC